MEALQRLQTPLVCPPYKAVVWAFLVILLYGIQIWATSAFHGHLIDMRYHAIMLACACLEAPALYLMYHSLLPLDVWPPVTWLCIIASAATMLALSLWCSNPDIDAFAYVGWAKLPHFLDAYAPPPLVFTGGGFDGINVHWGPQLPPLNYGPLWLALDRLAVAHAQTYANALLTLRLLGAVFVLALVLMMKQLDFKPAILALVAINPMLFFYYIVEAHSDLFAILLIVSGMAVARRSEYLGAIVAGAAGLVKIALVLPAALVVKYNSNPKRTLAQLAIIISIVLIGSALGGGHYVHAMSSAAHKQVAGSDDFGHIAGLIAHLGLAILAFVATLMAVFASIFVPSATFGFSAISSIAYAWYMGWCIPYALRMPELVPKFFVALPLVAFLIDRTFSPYPPRAFLLVDCYYVVTTVIIVWQLARILRSRYYQIAH